MTSSRPERPRGSRKTTTGTLLGRRFGRGIVQASGGPRVAAWSAVALFALLVLALIFDF